MDYKYENISLLDFIKTLSAYKGTTIRKLLAKLNAEKNYSKCYAGFYNKLKNDTLKFKEMNDIADTLGYEIVLREINNKN